jgi:cytochrome c
MKKFLINTAAVVALGLVSGAQAQDAAKLAQDKSCLACHQIDKKLVGPSYKDVSKKYAADKGAEAKLIKKVREGGTGVWGQIPMPPNTGVNEKEAQILVKWILSQK